MKKRLIIICLIVAGIFSAAVSDTMSIYTKSFNYNITLEDPRPLKPEEFYCYEIHKGDYPTGKVDFNEKEQKITLNDESGAMRTMTRDHFYQDYTVHAQIDSVKDFKNFGVSFNGSYLHNNTNVQMIHYTMRITDDYQLVILQQGVVNNQTGQTSHEHDEYQYGENFTPVVNTFEPSLSQGSKLSNSIDVSNYLKNRDPNKALNIQIKVSLNQNDRLDVYFYIDGKLLNPYGTWTEYDTQGKPIIYKNHPIPFRLRGDLRDHQTSSDGTITIGVNSYGKNQVVTSLLYMEQWDGKDFKYHES